MLRFQILNAASIKLSVSCAVNEVDTVSNNGINS